MEVLISSGVYAQILAEAAAAHPHEACGILLGQILSQEKGPKMEGRDDPEDAPSDAENDVPSDVPSDEPSDVPRDVQANASENVSKIDSDYVSKNASEFASKRDLESPSNLHIESASKNDLESASENAFEDAFVDWQLAARSGDIIAQIHAARPTQNVHPDPSKFFEIDPEALIAAHKEIRAQNEKNNADPNAWECAPQNTGQGGQNAGEFAPQNAGQGAVEGGEHGAAQAAGRGWQILGYYHSHPQGAAQPSQLDRASSARDGSIWAIAARDHIRFWWDKPTGFEEVSSLRR